MTAAEQVDLVVVGGGPAGLSAAIEARAAGVSVVLLDEGPEPGGQIFRRYGPGFTVSDSHAAGHEFEDGDALIGRARESGTDIRCRTVVWGAWGKTLAYVSDENASGVIEARAIVIATGARDRAITFPGWTLPGVITAGAAKTLVAIQRVLPGKRILMAGSGPLALAFSAQLREYGANIVEVTEAAPGPSILDYLKLALHGERSVLMDAARYRSQLMLQRVPLSYSTMIVRAEGGREVERAIVAKVDREWRVVPGTERSIDADTVLLGYGLESNSEFSRLLNCEQRFDRTGGGWLPVRDERMRTSVPGVYAAGDGAGVGGSRSALQQGRIAGISAAAELGAITEAEAARRLAEPMRRMKRINAFVATLNKIYAVGPGLYELATPETFVCRCEERTQSDLEALIDDGVGDINAIRAQSRIGMGRCQGRNCATHVSATIARKTGRDVTAVAPPTARPPVKPVPVGALASERYQRDAEVQID
jgi:NADPH-dependent 2,4-dienoyl-CoA reductase/sulfur reductase-like enzyme